MQTTLERINPTKVKLIIQGTTEELTGAKQQALKNLGTNVRVPGFRAGKAPESMVEKYLDPNTLGQETLEIAVNVLYNNALIEQKLRPVNNPDIKITSFVPYDQLSFEADVEVIGDVKLGKYKGLEVKKEQVKVSATEINEVIERMRNQLASKDEVDRSSKSGDEVVIDFKGVDTKTKEPINGADGTDYPLILGSNTFIPGFEDALVGLKKDDKKSFDITFPEDYGVKSLQKKKVTFSITVKSVNGRKLPAIDDAMAKLVGPFDSVQELKDDIKKELKSTKDDEALAKLQNDIVEKIVKTSKVDIPDSLVHEELTRLEREQRQNAAYRGLTWAEYLEAQGLSEEDFSKTAKEQAEQRIKMGLVLGAVASEEDIMISDDELKAKLEEFKLQYSSDQQMLEELKKADNQQDIKNRLLVEKTVNRLVELNKA